MLLLVKVTIDVGDKILLADELDETPVTVVASVFQLDDETELALWILLLVPSLLEVE
jgi:hypothetical protein